VLGDAAALLVVREGAHHLIGLVVEKAREDEPARRLGHERGHPQEQRPHQVGRDHVGRGRRVLAQIRKRHPREPHAVGPSAGLGGLDGRALVVERRDRSETEARSSDRDHPGAAPKVDEGPRGLEAEEQLETPARGGMRAGAESLAGIDHDVLDARPLQRGLPGRPDP
jgi:hypothetical protein